MIRLDEVSLSTRGRSILERATATIPAGAITHLTGKNGSGKTSLIRAIAGLQRYSGTITMGGHGRRRPAALYVCFDDAPVFGYLSGYENIRLLLGRPLSRGVIESHAPAIVDPRLLGLPARQLSHGQRKRLHLLAALLSGAPYLIFDEALDGVDAPTLGEVAAELRRSAAEATVLITGHHRDGSTAFAGRTLVLSDGRLSSPEAEEPAA